MYFDDISQIRDIASRTGCAIFVLPDDAVVQIDGAIDLKPEEKTVITIEQVRDVLSKLAMKQLSDIYVVVRPADKLGEDAANAFLKSLEEPKEKVHFILVTSAPSKLLPTILSRAEIYFLKRKTTVADAIVADEKTKGLAKRLIAAKPGDLVGLADELTKKKDGVRTRVLSVLGVAIEMLYKSYFMTDNDLFIKKLPKFLACYEAIDKNGHIKLHLVADLI